LVYEKYHKEEKEGNSQRKEKLAGYIAKDGERDPMAATCDFIGCHGKTPF
jgi:hypothetical protein